MQILRLWGLELENADFEAVGASIRECRFFEAAGYNG